MIAFTLSNAKLWSKFGSRGVFGGIAMPELFQTRDDIFLLPADVASSAGLNRLQDGYPNRILSMGIAEQNAVGVAAGLAKEGNTPFVLSFAPFVSLRCADQIRLCCGYMGLPLKLVALASGLAMGINGPSHLGYEDMAFLRAVPNITIFSPADCSETVKAVLAAVDCPGPVYIRLTGELNNPPVYTEDYEFQPGKAVRLREGRDVAFIATGTMVHACLEAAKLLEAQGCSAAVLDMHTISPLDDEAVLSCRTAKLIVTAEEHSVTGGLGGAVAECLAESGTHPPLLRLGFNSAEGYPHADTYANLLERLGLTPEGICQSVMKALHG